MINDYHIYHDICMVLQGTSKHYQMSTKYHGSVVLCMFIIQMFGIHGILSWYYNTWWKEESISFKNIKNVVLILHL